MGGSGKKAARLGDHLVKKSDDFINKASTAVFINGPGAARVTDTTAKGDKISQGSQAVNIGDECGKACSPCPTCNKGSPVNPLLGAKVLPDETDVALPGPLPFVVSRSYSSYQTDTPAPVGLLGPGWWLSLEASLMQSGDELLLNDTVGRGIHFEPLAPGEITYSDSEDLWIVRGGLDRLDGASKLALAWQGIKPEYCTNPAFFFAANDPLGPWFVFSPNHQGQETGGDIKGQRLPQQGLIDRFGRMQRFERALPGQPDAGALVGVFDGAGRHFRLKLMTMPHVANDGAHGWGADSGLRLQAVYLRRGLSAGDQPPELLVRYGYTAKGELATVHGRGDALLRSFEYHPLLLGRMTAHSHAGRPPSSYTYNAEGKVVTQTNPGALSYQFDYLPDSTVITDSLRRKETLHFKGERGLRRVVKVEYADGSVTESQYDSSGRLTARIDPLGRKTEYDVDVTTGNVNGMTAPDGKQTRFQYDEHGNVVRAISPGGAEDRSEYDELGRLSVQTNALGQSTRYRYPDTKTDLPHEIEDARGGIKKLEWNSAGQVTRYTDCSGNSTEYRYDRWGQLEKIQDQEGLVQTREYDSQGRLIAQTDTAGKTTRFQYDAASQLIEATAPDGQQVRYERDGWGNLTASHQGGLTQRVEYDQAGRLTTLLNKNKAKTTFRYDVMDRLIEQINFDGRRQRYSYDAAGQLIESNDAGQVSSYQHDKAGRLMARATNAGAPEGFLQNLHYDANGRLIEALNANGQKRHVAKVEFTRDKLGRVTAETQSLLNADDGQQPFWQHQIKHQYDELGNEDQTAPHGLPAIDWLTYGSGHLHGVMLGQRSLIDFERDSLYRETARSLAGTRIYRQYDNLSRLTGICAHDEALGPAINRSHHYDVIGQLIGIDTAGGPIRYGYDKAGRLIEADLPGQSQSYQFDPAGNRLFDPQRIATEQQDWAEQVRQNIDNPKFNPLKSDPQAPESRKPVCWMDNRILDDGQCSYQYDQFGNLIEKHAASKAETHSYGYDANQRLIQYKRQTPDKTITADYAYDPFGRRVLKRTQETDQDGKPTSEPRITFYGWDGDRLVLTEENGQHIHTIYQPGSFIPLIRIEGKKQAAMQTLARKFEQHTSIELTGDNQNLFDRIEQQLRQDKLDPLIEQYLVKTGGSKQMLKDLLDDGPTLEGKTIHFYHCDHLGTPIALLNQQGELDWSIELDPWGNVLKEHNPKNIQQPIRLQGQHFDEESGLHYNRHRYYDPRLGRYINQDPIGFIGGVNFYLYARGNPLVWSDPLGLSSRKLTECEKDKLKPYIPENSWKDLDSVNIHTNELPKLPPRIDNSPFADLPGLNRLPGIGNDATFDWDWIENKTGVQVEAMTIYNDIYFRNPNQKFCSAKDLGLLAHELYHVMQYDGGLTVEKYIGNYQLYETPAKARGDWVRDEIASNKKDTSCCP